MSGGQGDDEGRPLARSALGLDAASVALGYLAAYGQADARALVLAPAVEALEDAEDALDVLIVEADAVVLDEDPAPPGRAAVPAVGQGAVDPDDRRLAGLAKLQAVADEVLKKLAHLEGVGLDGRKLPHLHPTPALEYPLL